MNETASDPEIEWCFSVNCAGGAAEVRVRQNGDVVFTHGERAGEWLSLDGISYPTRGIDLSLVPVPPAVHINPIDMSRRGDNLFAERYVYHYTSAEKALNYILPSQRLLLSRYKHLNDPRESKEWAFGILSHRDALGPGGAVKLGADISATIKKNLRVLCFANDGAPLLSPVDVNPALASGWDHPNMWNHYGDKYRGVVLVFNRRKLLLNAQQALASKFGLLFGDVLYLPSKAIGIDAPFLVDYVTQTSIPVKDIALNQFNHWGKQLCFIKHAGWSTEQECRLVAVGGSAADEFVSIDGALTEILIGADADAATFDTCKTFSATLGVGVATVDWRNGQGIRLPPRH